MSTSQMSNDENWRCLEVLAELVPILQKGGNRQSLTAEEADFRRSFVMYCESLPATLQFMAAARQDGGNVPLQKVLSAQKKITITGTTSSMAPNTGSRVPSHQTKPAPHAGAGTGPPRPPEKKEFNADSAEEFEDSSSGEEDTAEWAQLRKQARRMDRRAYRRAQRVSRRCRYPFASDTEPDSAEDETTTTRSQSSTAGSGSVDVEAGSVSLKPPERLVPGNTSHLPPTVRV